MSDKWDGLLGGPLPTPVAKRPAQPDRNVPWARILGLVLVLALVGAGVWRATSRGNSGQASAPVTAQTGTQFSHPPTSAPASVSDVPDSQESSTTEQEPGVAGQSTSPTVDLFDGAHRLVDDYAHAFYERQVHEEWPQVAQKIQGLSTTAWAVELTNSPDRQDTMLAPMMHVVDVAVTVEDANPHTSTQWTGTLALIFEDEAGNRVERSVNAGAEVVPGIGWRISRWEEAGDE